MRAPLDGNILITGASSGIGLALAEELAPRAGALVLVARRKDRLEALAAKLRSARPGLRVEAIAADLLDRTSTDAMLEAVVASVGEIDVLVNNAGMGDMGMFDLSDWDKTERMLQLNVMALAYLTHRLAAGMVARGRGGILQVSSGFGLQFMPGFAAYVGTKHFVTGFSESLRLELKPHGVVVSQLCPGPVSTEFADVARDFDGPEIPSAAMISAEQCAREAIRGFARGKAIIIPGRTMRTVMGLGALTPRALMRVVYGAMVPRMREREIEARTVEG